MNIKNVSILVFLFYASACFCQTDTTKNLSGQQDIRSWLNRKNNKQPATDNFLLIMPVIGSTPASGFMFGMGMSYAFKLYPADQRLSTLTSNASYSTKGLINTNIKSNVFLAHEKWLLNGDWRYVFNPETTYGLGTKKNPGDINLSLKNGEGQLLKYSHIRFHEIVSRKVLPDFFAGFGLQYDHYAAIKDKTLATGDTAGSWHYQYNHEYGFSYRQYTTSGISFNLLYDNRDNELNAYKGYYIHLNYLINNTSFGSSENSRVLLAEYRAFYALDEKKKNILAFWLYGNFVTGGTVPYLALPALGFDERGRSGRGYPFGRFRGENLLYTESEYRFPISARSGIIGGALFLNLTTTSDKSNNIRLMNFIRAGYGGGLRIMLDKKSRSRLTLDGAIAEKKFSFYLGIQETF